MTSEPHMSDRPVPDQPTAYEQEPFRPPAGATELLFVRHGQSQAYLDGTSFPLVDGHGDPPLSAYGHEQASRLCARLGAEGVGAIYVSTLRRTRQTAEPLAVRLGLTVRVEPDLREVHLGEWEGGEYRKRVAESDPIALRMFEQERWDVIPGAEPAAGFAGRVRAVIGRLAAGHPDECIAVFTHGGVIGQALALATGSRLFAFTGADNASISRLLVVDGRWIVRSYNDTAHLS